MTLRKLLDLIRAKFGKEKWTCLKCNQKYLTEEGIRRHREINHQKEFVVFRCTECGKIYNDIGSLHGHAERHTPFYSFANIDRLMSYTEKLRVTDYDEIEVNTQ